MRVGSTFLAVAAAAAISGCGGAAESAAPSPSPSQDKRHQLEAAKADCMKQKGFEYVAFVQEFKGTDQDDKRAAGDYQAMQKYREKHGFGVFSRHVYPQAASRGADPVSNPNGKIQSSLSSAQMGAYRKALDACTSTSIKQVLGLEVKSDRDYYTLRNKAARKAVDGTLNTDPTLVELASAMATCLKGKGYSIADTTPAAMSGRGQKEFLVQEDKLGREQFDDVPDVTPPANEDEIPMYVAPNLTPEQARPYLQKEVEAALDDLECGKDFYAAYMPKESAIQKQVNDQFGM
ncbi:hypothetical protein [Nonomuraea sp. SYSU D8015]|uniref:hypothetical protein n=1 Tax=Nonomuraea sp. SYSU D8015 TaxID=2593644 RepID=UPI0016607681|nr:hypothetical protein [Nonomuraea sp. SYSU D8015]